MTRDHPYITSEKGLGGCVIYNLGEANQRFDGIPDGSQERDSVIIKAPKVPIIKMEDGSSFAIWN